MAKASTTHPSAQELAAFGLGKLSGQPAEAVARHLEACPACRQAVEDVPPDSFLGEVKAARPAGSGPPPQLPPELADHPRFRMVRELGRGGMGVVYQAEHRMMERRVAIKVINRSVLDHPDALARFHGEVKAAARLSHPNIVAAYDAERAGDLHMLVMEYVEGIDLAKVVQRKGPLPVAHACSYVRQAALGLQHAFEQGMVHRDIKPQNLMLTPKGRVKVLDFGLARLRSEQGQGAGLTRDGAFMGTPEYVAPEQATDAHTADIKADLYSLGCTLYYLLAGRPPFAGDTPLKLVLAHLDQEAMPLNAVRAEVPAELAAVVAKMMAKDPARRFQKPAEVAQALLPFIKAAPAPAAPAAPTVPPDVASAGKGTMIPGDTSRVLPAMPGQRPRPAANQGSATAVGASAFEDLADPTRRPKQGKERRPAPVAGWRQRWPLLAGAAGAAVLGLVVLLGVVVKLKTRDGVVTLENVPADAEVFVDGRKVTVSLPGNQEPVRVEVPEGRHQLKVTTGGHEVTGEQVTVRWGQAEPLKIALGPKVAGPDPPRPPGPKAAAGKVLAYRHRGGRWRVEGDELIQEDANANLSFVLFGDSSWTDYDVTVEAQRIEGTGLCFVTFRVESLLDFWGFVAAGDTRRIFTRVDGTNKAVQSKGWKVDNEWHKIGVRVRGEHIQCFMDGDPIFDFSDSRHPRGAVAVVSPNKSASRFRNLKVTDVTGRVLVDGVGSLELAAEQGDPAANDPVKAGTVWKGSLRRNADGKDLPDQDALVKIRKREGTRFEGELWTKNETAGLRIEGTVDGLGNISWKATAILAGDGWAPNILDVFALGAVKGKQLRAYGYYGGPHNLIAEVLVTRED